MLGEMKLVLVPEHITRISIREGILRKFFGLEEKHSKNNEAGMSLCLFVQYPGLLGQVGVLV